VSGRFEIRDTPIQGLRVVNRTVIRDERGFLERLYSADELVALSGERQIVQINRTRTSHRGAVRGLHYQSPPHDEDKYVTCLTGIAFDVAVDIRSGSPTFLQWHAEVLNGAEHSTVFIPRGLAHGFQTLTETCELLYLHTAAHVPSAEGGLNPRDPALAIDWPEEITAISARDAALPMLTSDYRGMTA